MSPATDPKLGDFIRRHREKAGLSGYKLAEDAGLSRSQVHRIEHGDIQPGPDTLARIAGPLQVAVEDLLAVAGYTDGLPSFIYLREKYGLSDEAVAEAEEFFRDLQEREKGGGHGKRSS